MLLPHIHLAVIRDRVIVLDIAADRYRRLSLSTSVALIDALAGEPLPCAVAQALVEQGILSSDADRPLGICQTAKATQMPPTEPNGAIGFVSLAIAVTKTALELRLAGLEYSLERLEHSAASSAADRTSLAALARSFDDRRAWLPLKRRCLPDALAFHHLLTRTGFRPTLVIGVTDQPFGAHCWLQEGDLLLTGNLDEIAPFQPIFAL